jgi:gamma-glutamylputrescine oxidase
VNYFRMSEDGRLLFGGSEGYGYRFPPNIGEQVRKPLEQVFPQLKGVKIDYAWGGSLAITMSRLPYLARPEVNIWSASGFSGHGVVLTGITGALIAKAILGQTEGFDLFARIPARRFPGGPAMAAPLLRLAMTWYALRDRLGF